MPIILRILLRKGPVNLDFRFYSFQTVCNCFKVVQALLEELTQSGFFSVTYNLIPVAFGLIQGPEVWGPTLTESKMVTSSESGSVGIKDSSATLLGIYLPILLP